MELILSTDLTALQPIEFNYDALRAALDAKLEKYRNLIIEDADIPDAKKDRADLNKLTDSINAERIRIKKQYLEPYDKFESKLKELTGMISKPAGEIDSKIKEFETRLKKEKRAAIERFYKDNVKDLSGMLTLEKIYNPKWDNAGTKLMDVTQEIMASFERVQSDLDTIKSMTLKHETAVLGKYIETLNLGEAIKENSRLLAIETAAAEREAEKVITPPAPVQRPVEAYTAPAILEKVEEAQEAQPVIPQKTATPDIVIPAVAEELITVDIRVKGTQSQLEKLIEFLAESKIEYGEVPGIEAV